MNKLILIAASSLALAGCGATDKYSNAEAPATGAPDTAIEGTAAADATKTGIGPGDVANTAETYAANAANADLFEIESSRLALEKAQSPQVKAFAQQMITDHTATSKQLKAAVAGNLKRTLPTSLDERAQAKLDSLRPLSGAAFDKAYIQQQAAAHQEALMLHGCYADKGSNNALEAVAKAALPKIQHHAEQLKTLGA